MSPKTEKLCHDKTEQIESRIRQFEQLEQLLSQAIDSANSLTTIRQQKDVLLRNLDQVQATPLYQSLTTLKENLEQLETFFERLGELDRMLCNSPEDLNALETQITNIEAQFTSWLNPPQVNLLESKKQHLARTRQQEAEKAHQWLANLYTTGAKLDELLRLAQNPPLFLSAEDLSKLEQVKQRFLKEIEKDRLLKIESLFAELDPQARRECLRRLQALMDEP